MRRRLRPKSLRAQPAKWRTRIRDVRRFFDPLTVIAAMVVVAILIAASFPSLVAPYGYEDMMLTQRLKPPSLQHLLGTDNFGRDTFSRLVFGARVSVYVGVVAVLIASTLGVAIGILSGFYGGSIDAILMRLVDVMLSFPSILFALVLITLLGPSVTSLIITMGIIYSPRLARLARAGTMSVKNEEYVEGARAVGVPNLRILVRYILPNIVGPLVVQASLLLPIAILVEATLSFLGLGVQPPTPSWGAMLSAGRSYMEIAPWLTVFPGAAIAAIVLSVNLLGDAAQDWANPRLRRRM